jgi:hypothetical protein
VSEIPAYPDECEHKAPARDECAKCLRATMAELETAFIDAYGVVHENSYEWKLRPSTRALILVVRSRRLGTPGVGGA